MSYQPIVNDPIHLRPDDNIQDPDQYPAVLRHDQWAMLGSSQVTITNVGYTRKSDGTIFRHPLGVATDPLLMILQNGAPIYGGGLMSTQALEYACFVKYVEAFFRRRYLTIVPFDSHVNYERDLNPDALTNVFLTQDFLAQLLPEDRRKAESYFAGKIKSAEPLTVAEWIQLFGDPLDGEFRDHGFFVHCVRGIAQFTPEIADLFDEVKHDFERDKTRGDLAPNLRLVPVMKTTILGNVAPNRRGLGGNHFDAIIEASQARMPKGAKYDHLRQAVVGGTSLGYSLTHEVYHLLAKGFRVHILAGSAFVIPGMQDKFSLIRNIKLFHPEAVTASYSWPAHLAGDAPAGYDRAAEAVRQADRASHRTSEAAQLSNTFGDPASPYKVIEDWE